MTLLTLGALAIIVVSLILAKAPPLWPIPSLHGIHFHKPGMYPASRHS